MRPRTVATVAVLTCLVIAGIAPAAAGTAVTVQDGQVAPSSVGDDGTVDTTNQSEDESASTTVTLLTYNDIQTAAAKTENAPRMATVIQNRRKAHSNPVFVAGGGDQVSPHALSPVSQWEAPIAWLNEVNPDADVIGNHDLDYGFGAVENFSAASEFPWLATNIIDESDGETIDGTKPYHVVERDGVKVGYIGLADGAIKGKTAVDFDANGVTLEDFTTAGPETAEMLKQEKGVDVVVALAHIGIPEAKTLAEADGEDYIDAIVVGDDELKYPPQETAGSVIVEGQARAEYVGEVNFTVQDGEVTAWNGRLINVTDDVQKNSTVESIINEYRAEVSLDSTAGNSTVELDARFATNYHRESNYGNLITDAMRWQTDADVAITNAGGIRSNAQYGPGAITGGDVFNTLPFANTVVVVELTGRELKETLQSQVVTLGSYVGQQFGAEISQQVSGVTFEWVPHEDAKRQIQDVWVGDERLDPEETYEVAVNSYIAGGGSGYPLADKPRVNRTGKLLATTVIDYLEAQGTVSPQVEGRMRRVTYSERVDNLHLDGEGLTVIRVDEPRVASSVDWDSLRATSPGTNTTVEPLFATRLGSRGNLWVFFDDSELTDLAKAGTHRDVDFYAEYDDRRYSGEWVYWDTAVLNFDTKITLEDDEPSSSDANSLAPPSSAFANAGT